MLWIHWERKILAVVVFTKGYHETFDFSTFLKKTSKRFIFGTFMKFSKKFK